MTDHKGRMLYIGKAANLRNRVRSYFVKGGDDRPSTRYLVERVHTIRTILTQTEKEALILENNLIKEHRPKYNVDLRDDKSFFSLRLNVSHPFPRLTLVRTQRVKMDGERYFGPYSSAKDARVTLGFIQKLFPLRQCTDRQLTRSVRPCLNCQMRRCLCPCTGKISPDEYNRMVKGAMLLLQRKSEELITHLKDEMFQAARDLRFEEAAKIRDRLSSVERTLENQNVSFFHRKDQDVIAIINPEPGSFVVQILSFRQGNLLSEDSFVIHNRALNEEEVLAAAIEQYYHSGAFVPSDVLISRPVDQASLIEAWLTEIRKHRVNLRVPLRGAGLSLMSLALKNAHNSFLREKHKDTEEKALASVAFVLKLPGPPTVIEGYDISNTSGSQPVGVKITFRDGKPDKSAYRKYGMRGFSDQDDPGMILQTLSRRLTHVDEDPLPDLILIDGGKAQLNAAHEALRQNLSGSFPSLVAIAKIRSEGESERFYLPNRKNPVLFPKGDSGLMLLMRVRDEAHRFAHTYHSKTRKKQTIGSKLDEVSGIGFKKRQMLLKTFGSLRQLLQATDEDIEQVTGIGKKDVERIRSHFRHGDAELNPSR